MRTTVIVLILLAFPCVAFGRGPTLAELPTIERVQKLAGEAIKAAAAAAAEAAKDPKMELIQAYATGTAGIFSYKPVLDILKDGNEEIKYRQASADAIRAAFKSLAGGDQRIERLKREIAIALLTDLNDKNQQVRTWVHGIYQTFWPGRAQAIGFKPETSNFRERYKAYKEWQKFLRK